MTHRQQRAVQAALDSLTARDGSARYADVDTQYYRPAIDNPRSGTVTIHGPIYLGSLVADILAALDAEAQR